MQGNVCLFDSAERRGIFSDGPKPLALLHETISVMGPGRFPEGQTEIPFEAEVKGIDGMVNAKKTLHPFPPPLTAEGQRETAVTSEWFVRIVRHWRVMVMVFACCRRFQLYVVRQPWPRAS